MKSLNIALCGLALGLSSVGAAPVAAAAAPAPVVFSKDVGPDMAAIIKAVYGDFLKSHPDINVVAASSSTPDSLFFLKFISKETCYDASACDTVALRKTQASWRIVFEHSTRELSLQPPAANYFSENMPTLVVDGRIRWVWSGLDHYLPEISSLGVPFAKAVPAARESAAAMSKILNETFHAGTGGDYKQAELSLGEGDAAVLPFYWVGVYRGGLCSNDIGCPYAILYPRAGGLSVLWRGYAMGGGVIMDSVNDGMHDIALGTKWGYQILRYDGKKYNTVETSYPSSVTPVP